MYAGINRSKSEEKQCYWKLDYAIQEDYMPVIQIINHEIKSAKNQKQIEKTFTAKNGTKAQKITF